MYTCTQTYIHGREETMVLLRDDENMILKGGLRGAERGRWLRTDGVTSYVSGWPVSP